MTRTTAHVSNLYWFRRRRRSTRWQANWCRGRGTRRLPDARRSVHRLPRRAHGRDPGRELPHQSSSIHGAGGVDVDVPVRASIHGTGKWHALYVRADTDRVVGGGEKYRRRRRSRRRRSLWLACGARCCSSAASSCDTSRVASKSCRHLRLPLGSLRPSRAYTHASGQRCVAHIASICRNRRRPCRARGAQGWPA